MTPDPNTVEHWAREFLRADSLEGKLTTPPRELRFSAPSPPLRVERPGRPVELRVVAKAKKTRGLTHAEGRARAMHTFFHHELQAAELMAWALLAFPETPNDFRAGLASIAADEIRHMRIYAKQVERLGFAIGSFEVRDWFWERVPTVADPAGFVAVMGMGLESANLEHASDFAARFRAAGDEEGARAQEVVAREEIDHVAFGTRWFRAFRGDLSFDDWCACLPTPLTPLLMRGTPLRRDERRRAGQPEAFLDALGAWTPESPSS